MQEHSIKKVLELGVTALKEGKYKAADRYFAAILQQQPEHPDANYNMGILTEQLGDIKQSLGFFEKASRTNPKNGHFWIKLVKAAIAADDFETAAIAYEGAQKSKLGDTFLNKLDNCLKVQNGEPINEILQKLLNLYNTNKYQEVVGQIGYLLKLFPHSFYLHNISGAANRALKNYKLAKLNYESSIKINPKFADTYLNFGNLLSESGDFKDAEKNYKKAISINPSHSEAYFNLGNLLQDQGDLLAAIDNYLVAVKIKPDHTVAFNNMGNAKLNSGKIKSAIEDYRQSIKTDPNYAIAYNNLGSALRDFGDIKGALSSYKKALDIKPNFAEVHRNLSFLINYTDTDQHFLEMVKIEHTGKLSDTERCHLLFGLAKAYEDLEDFEGAFNYYYKANAIRKISIGYNIYNDIALFDKIKKTQTEIDNNSLNISHLNNELKPIFIIGMPRSGTTLIEQIVSNHSSVFGAGELDFVRKFGAQLITDERHISDENIRKFRDRYLNSIKGISTNRQFITDKMPLNFRFVSLILAAFPEAVIIHVFRSPLATYWSNFKHFFPSKALGYCFNLDDLAKYFALYQDLMNFWLSKYSDKIVEVNYDLLVTKQDEQIRKLIASIGLSWEDELLHPHLNARLIQTASQEQVKKPIYRGSSEKSKAFVEYIKAAIREPHLLENIINKC